MGRLGDCVNGDPSCRLSIIAIEFIIPKENELTIRVNFTRKSRGSCRQLSLSSVNIHGTGTVNSAPSSSQLQFPSREVNALNSADAAQLAVAVASEKLAEDIVMLDLRGLAPFADYFVIMSAGSSRQIEALEDDITRAMKDAGVSRFHREGTPASGWILLDFSDVIVHIFGPEEREFYELERLWGQAAQVVRIL